MNQPRLTQAQRTHLSDQRMLEAAVSLIVARGPSKTTLKAVGEQAGYSRGLAGYRFGSKTGMFEFIVRAVGDEWLTGLTRVTDGKVGYAAIAAATDEHCRFCREAPDHVRAFYVLWFDSVSPSSGLKDVVANIHARRRRDVADWIRAGKAAGSVPKAVCEDAVAGQFAASIVGIVYHWLEQPGDLAEVHRLHDNLKRTMKTLLQTPPVDLS